MDDNEKPASQDGWLFDENIRVVRPDREQLRQYRKQNRQNRKPINFRSVYLWMNVAFVIVLLGLLFGAASQPWYALVGIAWVVMGVIVVRRSRRHSPPPPKLFDDED